MTEVIVEQLRLTGSVNKTLLLGTSLYQPYCPEVHLLNQHYLNIGPAVYREEHLPSKEPSSGRTQLWKKLGAVALFLPLDIKVDPYRTSKSLLEFYFCGPGSSL